MLKKPIVAFGDFNNNLLINLVILMLINIY